MKVVVTGGRDYADAASVHRHLVDLAPTCVAHGCASGADTLADRWCIANGIQPARFPALWDYWRERGLVHTAGPKRNGDMLDVFQPDLVLAFPGGKGTADCVAKARERGIEVREVGRE